MSDNITLPREVVKLAIKAFENGCPSTCEKGMVDSGGFHPWGEPALVPCPACLAFEHLRTALAAEQPKQEPVAWMYINLDGECEQIEYGTPPTDDDSITPLYTAPPSTHPGYVIGSHWLETAYSRICAGEAEADVLRDCGWERVDDAEALRRENERLHDELRQSSIDITRAEVERLKAENERLKAENERLREALDRSLTDEQIRQIAASIDRSMPLESAKILFARRIEAALRREET